MCARQVLPGEANETQKIKENQEKRSWFISDVFQWLNFIYTPEKRTLIQNGLLIINIDTHESQIMKRGGIKDVLVEINNMGEGGGLEYLK